MDEGWSAVIAGAAGLAGAVIGGYFAKQGAIAGAKASANAIAQQVKQQSRNEHAHWVRGERRAAYDEVLRAYGVLTNIFAAFRLDIENEQPLDEINRRAVEANALFVIAGVSTRLFGPEDVWFAARDLMQETQRVLEGHQDYAHQRRAGGGPRLEETEASLTEARRSMGQAFSAFQLRSSETLLSAPNG
ncbi:hypothetical protein ABZS95_10310 [Streptomyces sp. NPDC005479]|uniref:hypothetical protein n=1 Tax=Streptomyces sp. NPDC005479 TaxID=3154879 RepID=UPI0033BBEB78